MLSLAENENNMRDAAGEKFSIPATPYSMTSATSFEDLRVWRKAHVLTLAVYRLTTGFPGSELYGLTSQMRRCAVSVPANIAEGFARTGSLDKIRFYNIAQASLEELRYYLILAKDLGYSDTAPFRSQLDELGRMLNAYVKAIRSSTKR